MLDFDRADVHAGAAGRASPDLAFGDGAGDEGLQLIGFAGDEDMHETREQPLVFERAPLRQDLGQGLPHPPPDLVESGVGTSGTDDPVAPDEGMEESGGGREDDDPEYELFPKRQHHPSSWIRSGRRCLGRADGSLASPVAPRAARSGPRERKRNALVDPLKFIG